MFESTRLDHKLDKERFKAIEAELRESLLNEQFELADRRERAILVLVNGLDGAGKGEVTNRLYEWLDAHFLLAMTYLEPTDEERARPFAWRYWRDLPARGRIGIVLGSWYHRVLLAHALGQMTDGAFAAALQTINRFEAMLDAEGVVILKLWLELTPEESASRLDKARRKGVLWRPVVEEWRELEAPALQQRLIASAQEAARVTSTGRSPWHVVPARDARYRDAAVGKILLDRLRALNERPIAGANGSTKRGPEGAAAAAALPAEPVAEDALAVIDAPTLLRSLTLDQQVQDEKYRRDLEALQERVTRATGGKRFRKHGLICAFEGNDAAGKGGVILRVRQALDPRRYRVHQIAAPSDEERARPYLWRFWRRIPAQGHSAFFDRSWYGRVLVERVEGFAGEADWRRAYTEINDFEQVLVDNRYVVVKFWLAISQEEQLRRFQAREAVPFKRFKLTPEDWRNREKWPLYERAVEEMIDRTSTAHVPWTLVEAESKRFARLKVLRTIADALEAAL